MFCPNCGLANPNVAQRCDCGYDFASGMLLKSYVENAPSRPLASLSSRWWGQFIDSLAALVVVLAGLAFSAITGVEAAFLAAIVFAVFYILCADGFGKGQSWGKRIAKSAVIHEPTGLPCSFGRSFLRNLPLAFLGIIDWVFIFFGDKRQRLGDRLASTIVIEQR